MVGTNKQIMFARGTTYSLTFTINNLEVEINEMYFTVKSNFNTDDIIIQKKINNGIEDLGNHKYKLTINADDTEKLHINQKYGYDVKAVLGSTKVQILVGDFIVSRNYTKKVNEV